MYEVEFKVELTAQEREEIIAKLLESGFLEKGSVSQVDCYVEAKKSPHEGYDLRRYRNEDGKLIYTQKIWEIVDGAPTRREEEREATQEEFEENLKKSTQPLTIKKNRQSFEGSHKDTKIHIDMDSVKFDHSPTMRYFIEVEIIVPKKEGVSVAKECIREFLKELLGKKELTESPGMFTMAFEKR